MQTYFIKDKEYHLHYTIGRMEQLEKILGNAITGVMVSITNGKYPTISELCTLFAYGLSDYRWDYAPIKKALEFAQQQVQDVGYGTLFTATLEQIQEDCGFLFR